MKLRHAIIIQRVIDTCKIVIQLGCLMPIAIGILIIIIKIIVGLLVDPDDVGFVPQLELHYKIKRNTYTTLDEETIREARLYFSRTDTFGTDYIDFHYTEVTYPKIYYVEPDTLYIIDRFNDINDICSKEFNIVYIEHPNGYLKEKESPKEFEERYMRQNREDSILSAKSYTFSLYEFTNSVTVFNPQGEIIYEKDFKLF